MGGKKNGAKAKAAKLPKRIGGLKLPKELRGAGGALLGKANSPAGRELIAAGLTMAATLASAAANKERAKAARAAAASPPGAPHPPAAPSPPPKAANRVDASSGDPHEIGVALGKMAEAALAGLFAGKKG